VKPRRLELARELGATHAIDPAAADPVEAIRAATSGGADFTLEATGLPEVLRQAVEALGPLGVCGIIGAPPPGTDVRLDVLTLLRGRVVRGIVQGDGVPGLLIPRLVELHRQGSFPFDRLLHFYELDQINQAADDSLSGAATKPVLRMP
jgi:aryl-alcohol dehydrogenase